MMVLKHCLLCLGKITGVIDLMYVQKWHENFQTPRLPFQARAEE